TFLSHVPAPHLLLHSFPTRRSSDLSSKESVRTSSYSRSSLAGASVECEGKVLETPAGVPVPPTPGFAATSADLVEALAYGGFRRSEEHTSELQSRVDLVCRLLLEKK